MPFDNIDRAPKEAVVPERVQLDLLSLQGDLPAALTRQRRPEQREASRAGKEQAPVPKVGPGTVYSDIIRDRFEEDIRFHLGPRLRRGDLVPPPAEGGPRVVMDNLGASPEFAAKIRTDLDALPAGIRKLLADNDMHVVISPSIIDAAPDLKDQHPRGWPDAATFANDDGAFRPGSRQILVAEKFKDDKGAEQVSKRSDGVLLHETGHAVDAALGNLSQSAEFKAAYDKDIAALSDESKEKLHYLLQTDGAGQQEAFAEIFAALNGSSANAHQTQLILQSFPEATALLKARIAAL